MKLYNKDLWATRKEWWKGTVKMGGYLIALTNIFPWLFWIRHPITAWRNRNAYLIIPGVNDWSCDNPNCGNAKCEFLREEGK